jgi:hypothetical protein
LRFARAARSGNDRRARIEHAAPFIRDGEAVIARLPLLPLLFLLALVLPAPARAAGLLDAPISYSATRTVTVDGRSYTGKVFHVPGHERHEQMLLGMEDVFLIDDRAETGLVILPLVKTMVSFKLPALLRALNDPAAPRQEDGAAVIDGVPTTRYRIARRAPDGSRAAGFLWISRFGVVMKLDGTVTAPHGHKTRIAMVLSHVAIAPQKKALFQPPEGLNLLPAAALEPLLGFKLD